MDMGENRICDFYGFTGTMPEQEVDEALNTLDELKGLMNG